MDRKYQEIPKLKIPYYPDDDKGLKYDIETFAEKTIHDYTGYDFDKIENLNLIEYLSYFRDGIIYELSQTEHGREYLEKCWILEQTEPERCKLRHNFHKISK